LHTDKKIIYVIQKSALLFLKKGSVHNGSAYEPSCYYYYFN
jgi:hypothetical protein